jgi:hypothetical protein
MEIKQMTSANSTQKPTETGKEAIPEEGFRLPEGKEDCVVANLILAGAQRRTGGALAILSQNKKPKE